VARRNLWEEVEDLLEQKIAPVIQLDPSSKVVKPKRPVGRPRIRKPGATKYQHFESHTPAGHRMVCRAQGCRTRLRKNDVLVCSDQCRNALRESCELYLSILNGDLPRTELPQYMRSDRLKRGWKFTM
jgi:hypothetical protein